MVRHRQSPHPPKISRLLELVIKAARGIPVHGQLRVVRQAGHFLVVLKIDARDVEPPALLATPAPLPDAWDVPLFDAEDDDAIAAQESAADEPPKDA